MQNDGYTKNRVGLGNLKEFSLIREWGYMGRGGVGGNSCYGGKLGQIA